MSADKHRYHDIFTKFAERAAMGAGTPYVFSVALFLVALWVVTGPVFDYSHAWELTGTMVPAAVTFLLVFLIQSSQNREILALQLKLNELIRATQGAHTTMVNLEKMTEEELEILCKEYEILAQEARSRLKKGESDQDAPEISVEIARIPSG